MSAAKTIPKITIDGSNKLYNGEIYSANVKLNFGDQPTEFQVNVVSEDGKYQNPEINFTIEKILEIGSLKIKGYLYKYKKRFSAQGSILELYYMDGTHFLDKIFIGLISKHEWTEEYKKYIEFMRTRTFHEYIEKKNSSKIPSKDKENRYAKVKDKFWVIGRLFHPCDKDKDNLLDFQEISRADQRDFCDPCPQCPEDKYDNRCAEMAYSDIFEVAYSFDDFITFFNQNKPEGITLDTTLTSALPEKLLKKYYMDFHGTAREVLSAWAHEFGLNWYFDSDKKIIYFFDLKKDIQPPTSSLLEGFKSAKKLISYEKETSSENSLQKSIISWYERAGESKNFNCQKSAPAVLYPLYGRDYLGNLKRTTFKGDEINANTDILGTILSKYEPTFRNIYWAREVYKIYDAKAAKEYITNLSIPLGTGKDAASGEGDFETSYDNKILSELGDVKILGVISNPALKESDPGENTPFQKACVSGYLDVFSTLSEYNKIKFSEKTGFFIVAYVNEFSLAKRLEREDELFSFLGKFYASEYLYRLCGITGNEEFVINNTKIEAPDGSAQIYSKKLGLGLFPFSKYKFYKSGFLGCLTSTGNRLYTSNMNITNTTGRFQNEHTTIFLEREPKWLPNLSDFQNVYRDYILGNYGDLEWKLLGEPQTNLFETESQSMEGAWVRDIIKKNKELKTGGFLGSIKIFGVFPTETSFKFLKNPKFTGPWTGGNVSVPHPIEEIGRTGEKKLPSRIGKYEGPEIRLGLLDTTCGKIEFEDPKLPKIYTPPHVFFNEEVKKDSSNSNSLCKIEGTKKPAYQVLVTQSFNQKVTLPKIQTGEHNLTGLSDGIRKLDVVYHKFTDEDFFSWTGYFEPNSLNPNIKNNYGCIPNVNILKNLHEAYTGNSVSITGTDTRILINIKGLPEGMNDLQASVKSGLSELEVNIGDNGLYTNIVYDTKRIKSISDNLLKFKNTYKEQKAGRPIY